MMYENQVLVTYNGIVTYPKKDGTEGSSPEFIDFKGHRFQMFVKESENLKDIPIGSKVIANQLHSSYWNKGLNKREYRIFYKSVSLVTVKE